MKIRKIILTAEGKSNIPIKSFKDKLKMSYLLGRMSDVEKEIFDVLQIQVNVIKKEK